MLVKMSNNPEMPVRKGKKVLVHKENQRFGNVRTTYGQNGYCLCENGQFSCLFSLSQNGAKEAISTPEAPSAASFDPGKNPDKSDLAIYTPENICYNQIRVSS